MKPLIKEGVATVTYKVNTRIEQTPYWGRTTDNEENSHTNRIL